MTGRIIKNISNDYTVIFKDKTYICKPRGKLKIDKNIPLVGDIVDFDEDDKIITKIHPRKNELKRPPIANIDIAIVVASTKKPNLDTYLLDKILTVVSYNNIIPIIYFTKKDLLNKEELKKIKIYIKYYKKIGYKVAKNTKHLLKLIKNKTVVLTGQSGAGKSTLLNKIEPALNLKTNEISYALGRGKHTTRHTEMFQINNTFIVDTPGFSKLDLSDMTILEIRDNMNEMYDNLKYCKYQDCSHINEEGCHVKTLVEKNKILKTRYDNYKNFIKENNLRR